MDFAKVSQSAQNASDYAGTAGAVTSESDAAEIARAIGDLAKGVGSLADAIGELVDQLGEG